MLQEDEYRLDILESILTIITLQVSVTKDQLEAARQEIFTSLALAKQIIKILEDNVNLIEQRIRS